jgi:hypothetical protein
MNDYLPARPKPAARGPSYAADFDQAERATPETGYSKVEVTQKTSKSGTIYERLSRTSTAGKYLILKWYI